MNAQQLQQLYTGLQQQVNSQQQLMFVNAVTALKLPITAAAYAKFVPDGQLQINGVSITMPDANTILINGLTDSFVYPGSGCDVTFYLSDNILYSCADITIINQQLSLPGITWFSIGTPFYKITVPEAAIPMVGLVGGNIATGVKLQVAMAFPVTDNTWLFQGSFSDPYPNISNFYQLLGGVNLTAALPQPFSTLSTLGLQTIAISYDSSAQAIDYISVTIGTPAGYLWQLLPGLAVTNISINSLISGFGASQGASAAFTINGDFTIGPAGSNNVEVIATVPNFIASVQLTEGAIQLGDLLIMFWNGTTINLQSEITTFNLQIAPTQKNYSLDCGIKSDWTFFTIQNPSLSFIMTGLGLQIASEQGSVSGKITGTFHIGPSTPDTGVDLTIFAGYASKTWTFGASTGAGQTISLGDIAATFLHAFGLDNIPSWVTNNLPEINAVSFLATVPDDKTNPATYNIQGNVPWSLIFGSFNLQLAANVNITYSSGGASGTITGTADANDMLGLTFNVGYQFGAGDTVVYLNIPQFSSTITYTKNADYDEIDIVFTKISLGELISTFVGIFSPGFSLSSPWDALNSIDLSNLKFTYTRYTDPTKSSIVVTIPITLDLVFINITGLMIRKDGSGDSASGVYVFVEGTFLGLTIEQNSPLQKGGKGADPTSMPPVPGMGSQFFDLKLLALGQHVSIYDAAAMNSVDETITALKTAFTTTSKPDSTTIPVPASSTTPGTLVFDQNSNWLIGADFTVAKFYRVAFVFNDPNMYGLLLGISKDADYFKNLQFEILYKKINDSIGVYQVDLQLPDQWRHLEFGEVSITLPIIGVKIYTNGNFYFDFGFPASVTDFSRSFSVQVFPFVGYGGFYFGYLSGATSTSVPATKCGNFNPVIVFGLGLSLGVGKTVDQGIMKAGLSLTVVGIFTGVIGFFRGNPGISDGTYYKIQGTFGLTGHIYGEINFAIISARLDVMAYAYVTITIESYMPIPISFEAGVSVSLTVKINMGLFSIHVSFHFSATISASFIIGSDTTAKAPWNACVSSKKAAAMLAHSAARKSLDTVNLKWQPITPPSPVPLDLKFFPHLTVSGDSSSPGPQYVAMLYINTGIADNSLAALTGGVLYWAINALIGSANNNTTLPWLQAQNVTASQISQLLCYFNTRVNNVAPFNYQNATHYDIETFLSTYFTLNISPVDPTQCGTMDGAVFPVLPELTLNTNYNGTAGNAISFAVQNMTGTQNYISDITALLASMGVDYESQVTKDTYKPSDCNNLNDPNYETQPNLSFPTFIFTDFIALIAKQALQSTLDYLNQQTGNTATVLNAVTNAVTNSVQGIGGMASRYMLHGLRLPAPPVAANGLIQPLYMLTGQQIALPQALKAGDQYSVLLQSPGINWVNMVGGANNTLTVKIDDNEIHHINDVGSTVLAPTLISGPSAIVNFNDTPQAFTLGSAAVWQYPGQLFSGATNNPTLWKLPSNLSAVFNAGGGETFTINTITNSNAGAQKGQVANALWSTSVDFSLQRIMASGGFVTPLSGNMYNLVGADEAGIVFLEDLISYLNTNNDANGTKTIQQIQVLYRPDPVNNPGGGYVSAANHSFKTAIVQANLSTETNPVVGLAMAAFREIAPPPRDYNTLNKAGDFIKLLWECSIVRSGGFYFYYNTSDNKGLPDTLFGDGGIANLTLVVTYDNLILAPFVNSTVIGDHIDTSKTSVYAQSAGVTTRVATILPGNVGYQVSRNWPGTYNPSQPYPTLADDQVYLQYQFNLIGALLPAIPSYKNLLPAGPADPMSESDIANAKKGLKANQTDTTDWNYNGVIPYYKYIQPGGTDPNYPNPYAGIGTNVQIGLNWQDMFGNIPPAGTTPLSASMQLLYSDAIVALSQWPSVSANYLFTQSTSPQLTLGFAFNTARYSGKGAQNNVQIDLLTYMKLFYQLSNGDLTVTYTTSIENSISGGVATPVNHTLDLGALLTGFINPIITMLKAVAGGGSSTAIAPYPVNTLVSTAGITTLPQITALTVSLTMQRTANLDPNFTNVQGVAAATTTIQPLSQSTGNGSSALTLLYFAGQFEQAYINQPAAGIVMKVATGTNITKGNSDTTETPPLWIVRFDTTGVNGIQFGFNVQQTYYFAPIPIATSLQSFAAGIYQYQEQQSFPQGNPVTKNFSSIDMDSWGLQFLQAVDKFLSPSYAVPAFLMTANALFKGDPDYLQKILDAKQNLAEAIEGTIDFIIDPCSGQPSPPCTAKAPANIGNAQEKWKQQILIQLSNAYRYVASVQTTAGISSGFTGVNNDPQKAPYAPVLYGNMAGDKPSIPGSSTAPKSTEYSLSTAKVPIASGNSWLTYMFEARDAAESRSFTFGDMEYAVSHIEFDIQEVPQMGNYLASSWLAFIVPLEGDIAQKPSPLSPMCDVGKTPIPVPLRAYPTPPSVSAQNFDYPVNKSNAAKTNAAVTVQQARTWDYTYTYQNPSAAQDTVITQIQFNVTQDHQNNYLKANTSNLPLYQALAQFISAYPAISADFDNNLAQITPAKLSATLPAVINARYAMLAFINIVNQVAAMWAITNQVNPRKQLRHLKLMETPPPPYTLSYTITESAQDKTGYLLVNIKPNDTESGTQTIAVEIIVDKDKYKSEPGPGKNNTLYYYTDNDGNKVYLTYDQRNSIASRTVALNGLDILNTQNAWSSVAVIRNEELLQNADGSWQTTTPSFIYQTPQVMFYNKLIPLLSCTTAIDIATIGTQKYPVQPQRTLSQHLLALFDALTENINSAVTGYTIKMQCDYVYTIPGTSLPVDIPVLMVTPTEISVADSGKSIADMLTNGITAWLNSNNPESNASEYTFEFTAYSATDSYVPVLQTPLFLSLASISGARKQRKHKK